VRQTIEENERIEEKKNVSMTSRQPLVDLWAALELSSGFLGAKVTILTATTKLE
jgi:hypothetical protein